MVSKGLFKGGVRRLLTMSVVSLSFTLNYTHNLSLAIFSKCKFDENFHCSTSPVQNLQELNLHSSKNKYCIASKWMKKNSFFSPTFFNNYDNKCGMFCSRKCSNHVAHPLTDQNKTKAARAYFLWLYM